MNPLHALIIAPLTASVTLVGWQLLVLLLLVYVCTPFFNIAVDRLLTDKLLAFVAAKSKRGKPK